MKKIHLYWVRRDFRLGDNQALSAAVDGAKKGGGFFSPVFILENYMLNATPEFQFGYPSRFFLKEAIPEFVNNFENFLLLKGRAAESIINLQKSLSDYKIEIHVNEDVYIDFYKQVKKIKATDIKINIYKDQLTINKETVSGTGNKYSVFTPFKKSVWKEFLLAKVLEKPNLKDLKYLDTNTLEKSPTK